MMSQNVGPVFILRALAHLCSSSAADGYLCCVAEEALVLTLALGEQHRARVNINVRQRYRRTRSDGPDKLPVCGQVEGYGRIYAKRAAGLQLALHAVDRVIVP